jgi:hypothetical protein
VIAKIPHWQPPWAIAKARADRGSPMYTAPETQSITKLVYSPVYDFLFPKNRFNLERVSYYFEHEMGDTLQDQQYDEIFEIVDKWQQGWRQRPRPYLTYRKALATIRIDDGRNGHAYSVTYGGNDAALYEYCADARSTKEIQAKFNDAAWTEASLTEFLERDYMVHLDGRYLSLALPANPYF